VASACNDKTGKSTKTVLQSKDQKRQAELEAWSDNLWDGLGVWESAVGVESI